MVDDDANKDDIIGFLVDRNVPGDEIVYNDLARWNLSEQTTSRLFDY